MVQIEVTNDSYLSPTHFQQKMNTSKRPPLPDNAGKRGKVKTIEGKIKHFTIVDQIHRFQSDNPNKALVLQKILFDDGRKEMRLAYYIIGKKPGMKGKWVWGQYATLMLEKDYLALHKKAINKGWFSGQSGSE